MELEAKEKAKELFDKFMFSSIHFTCGIDGAKLNAKTCATIAVDEIILSNPHSNPFNTSVYSTMYFWQEVKQEINNL